METNFILCPRCGRRLAQLLGEIGQRRRLKALGGARVRTAKNALGEATASIKCPKCEAVKPVDASYWPDAH